MQAGLAANSLFFQIKKAGCWAQTGKPFLAEVNEPVVAGEHENLVPVGVLLEPPENIRLVEGNMQAHMTVSLTPISTPISVLTRQNTEVAFLIRDTA